MNTANVETRSFDKDIAWRITHSSFRAFGYGTILLGLILGVGLSYWHYASVSRSFPKFGTVESPITAPQSSPNTTPLSSPQPSIKPVFKQTPEQNVQRKQWIYRENLFTQAGRQLWIVVGVLIIGALFMGILWLLRAFLQRSPKRRSPLEEIANSRSTPATQPKIAPQVLRDLNNCY